MRLRVLSIALPLTLAACTTTTAAPPMSDPQPPAQQASCNHEAAQPVVGQVATPETIERARTLAGARVARTLKPGQMVTMEYMEGRLNIDVDAKNVITHVRCG